VSLAPAPAPAPAPAADAAGVAAGGGGGGGHNTDIDEDLINFLVTILRGEWLVKHAQSRGMFAGRPARRFFWLDTTQEVLVLKWSKTDDVHSGDAAELGVGEITRVAAGMATDVLLRSGARTKQHLYFSLITGERSLDFECDNAQQRDVFFAGFARIVQQPRLLQEALIFIVAHGIWVPPAQPNAARAASLRTQTPGYGLATESQRG
jgi:hypothetical protein